MPGAAQPRSTQSISDPLREVRARLHAALQSLTVKQRGGIDRIITAEMLGGTIDSLLAGPDKMCSHKTYYGRDGWFHDPQFQEALRLAREVSFDERLSAAVRRARETIVLAAPAAASRLVAMLETDEAGEIKQKPEIVLRAAEGVLNRADRSTADRSGSALIEVTGDDIAAARDAAAEFERGLNGD